MKIHSFVFIALVALTPTMAKASPYDPLTKKQDIIELQNCLNNQGFDTGAPDGVVGNKLREAVGDFRSAAKKRGVSVSVSNEVNRSAMAQCKSITLNRDNTAARAAERAKPAPSASEMAERRRRSEVRNLQQCLTDLKFDIGTADGIAGKRTLAAVKQLRKEAGMSGGDSLEGAENNCYSVQVAGSTQRYKKKNRARPIVASGEISAIFFGKKGVLQWTAHEGLLNSYDVKMTIVTNHFYDIDQAFIAKHKGQKKCVLKHTQIPADCDAGQRTPSVLIKSNINYIVFHCETEESEGRFPTYFTEDSKDARKFTANFGEICGSSKAGKLVNVSVVTS